MIYYIAQAIGIVAMAMNILSYQMKQKRGIITMQLFGTMLFSVSFLMLGAYTGGLLNFLGMVRSVVFLSGEKVKAKHPLWLVGFEAAYVASFVLTFAVFGKEPTAANIILEFLPLVGMTATTISFRMSEGKHIRALGLVSSPSWLVYNIFNRAVGGSICEIVSLASIIVGMLRYDVKRKAR